MFKKFLYLSFLLMFLLPNLALAQELTVTVNQVPIGYTYNKDFESLVFDFTMTSPDQDFLKALVLNNFGGYFNLGIVNLCLYKDLEPTGFQGWGFDENLGCGTWNSMLNYWYWNNLNVELKSSGTRIFAVIETDDLSSTQRYIQIGIQALYDENNNGIFDINDRGYFTTKTKGPLSQMLNNDVMYLKNNGFDSTAPKAKFDNLTNNQVLDVDSYRILGQAKDRGTSGVSKVQININGSWFDTVLSNGNANWQYEWNNITEGNNQIYLKTTDLSGNSSETTALTITYTKPVTPPPPAQVVDYTDGRFIKIADNSAVYFLDKSNIRHAYPIQKVYESYFGQNFSFVQTISKEEMATYSLGNNVPLKAGSLMKIPSIPKVYKIGDNGTMQWIETEVKAVELYGANWASLVIDMPESFFIDYTEGESIK